MKARLKMRHASSKSAKGYTLTEVLVASALLIAVSVPMLKALTSGYMFSNSIKYKTKSAIYAKSRLEQARARAAERYNRSLTANNTPLGGGYLCSISDTGYSGDIRTISVSAGLDKNGNRTLASDEIQITLTTLIARR